MTRIIIAALAALTAAPVAAQTPYSAPTPEVQTPTPGTPPPMDVPILANAQVSPDCGNLYQLAGRAYCLTAPLASIGALADAYTAHFASQGWLAAAGEENRVVFVKRREGGGCDGLQMIAFYDTARPAGPEAPGYLGLATVPGNVCTGQTAQPGQ